MKIPPEIQTNKSPGLFDRDKVRSLFFDDKSQKVSVDAYP